jgi:hypothetical protein
MSDTQKSDTALQEDAYGFPGCRVRISSDIEEVGAHLRSAYAAFSLGRVSTPNKEVPGVALSEFSLRVREYPAGSGDVQIAVDGVVHRLPYEARGAPGPDAGVASAAAAFTETVLLTEIARHAPDHLFLRAAAVSWQGRGLVFPGHTRTGKTALALKLVAQGCRLLSDSVACIHLAQGIVEPFPRTLTLREEHLAMVSLPAGADLPVRDARSRGIGAWKLGIEEIVPGALSLPCVPRFLLFLRGFGENTRVEQVSSANAVFALPRFSLGRFHDPASLLFRLAPILDQMECFSLVMGDLDEAAVRIIALTSENQAAPIRRDP